MNRSRRVAIRSDREIALTRKQFALLEALMQRKGLVTSREQLILAGWGQVADVKENTLDVYIHGLRVKLSMKSEGDQAFIRTVHGVGYIFEVA